MLSKSRPGQCLRFAGGQEGGLSSGRIDSTASRPTQPRSPSPPHRALSRPDRPVVCPGFGFDRFGLQRVRLVCDSGEMSRTQAFHPGGRKETRGRALGAPLRPAHFPPRSAPLRLARPRPASPCPARGVSGFWFRLVPKMLAWTSLWRHQGKVLNQ